MIKYWRQILILLTVFFFSTTAIAEQLNFWRCTAFDAENKEWTINSNYQLTSVNRAFEACKKQSNLPKSCKAAKETCEVFINGVSTRPMWRCTALDREAAVWLSNVYSQRDDAALAAKAYCQEGSAVPETCYINTVTCRNLNSRE